MVEPGPLGFPEGTVKGSLRPPDIVPASQDRLLFRSHWSLERGSYVFNQSHRPPAVGLICDRTLSMSPAFTEPHTVFSSPSVGVHTDQPCLTGSCGVFAPAGQGPASRASAHCDLGRLLGKKAAGEQPWLQVSSTAEGRNGQWQDLHPSESHAVSQTHRPSA